MWRLSSQSGLPDALAPYANVERRPVDGRPWVLANMVCGLDGSTAMGGRVGALSSPTDRQLFVDLRSVADVVLVGAETVRRERYGPVVLSPERRRSREVMPTDAKTSEFRLAHVLEADGNLFLRYERP